MRRTLAATALAAALAASSLPSRAAAEETAIGAPGSLYGPGGFYDGSKHERRQQLSGFALLPWWAGGFGFGFGGRYALPLVRDGILPDLNDSIELELGLDAWYGAWAYGAHGTFGYMGLAVPVAEATWTFHITDHFDAYAKLGLVWHFERLRWGHLEGLRSHDQRHLPGRRRRHQLQALRGDDAPRRARLPGLARGDRLRFLALALKK
jgi:hypothetical protein